MPIYAYRCEDCGFTKDALQKLSDPPLTVCPACGKDTFRKQVTAAGFQLKGSGWYVTDFRGGSSGNGAAAVASAPAGEASGSAPAGGSEGAGAAASGAKDAGAGGNAGSASAGNSSSAASTTSSNSGTSSAGGSGNASST